MTKRTIITGISGFVGGHLAQRLLEAGDEVLGFSPDGQWLSTSPSEIRDRISLSAWDFSQSKDEAAVCQTIEHFEPDVVYHLAAVSVPADCGEEEPTEKAVAINVEGTRRVVEAMLAAAPRARLVFVSSSHVYAPVDPEAARVVETAPVGPTRGYGKTKLAAEQVVVEAAERHNLDTVIVRAFQHTGPRQIGRMMLPEWMKQIVGSETDPIRIHTRDARIDLLDVRDVVCAYQLLAEVGSSGTVYNVGSGTAQRTGDLIDRLLEIAGAERDVIETRPGFKQDPIADITRLEKETGWRPTFTVDQTLSDTLAWWQENYDKLVS
ncbi:MAG: NAD(P)-dependent oxidoreductase [Planctomycetia bacterium]|jgi:GDP-4-dehydro-6-deoxy-D-mannose reductase